MSAEPETDPADDALLAAPVVIIFGAAVRPDGTPSTALRRRVQGALRFGALQPGLLYMPTGGIGRHGPSEASVMARQLRAAGVPETRILLEETGTSTLTSVRSVVRQLRALHHTGRVYAASSAYHLPRCVLLLLLAGLDAWACPAPAGRASRKFRKRWYWRLRETVALPIDATAMLALRLARRL